MTEQPSDHCPASSVVVRAVLKELAAAVTQLIASGRTGAIDVRRLPRMSPETYRALRDALSAGEVTAVVAAEIRVEVSETRYPGVWWLTHRDTQGRIVTEIIEITPIPDILKTHVADLRAGLRRIEQALADLTPQAR